MKKWADRFSRPDNNNDYKVGYGRPPEHTRFKPGQSGNKKGRPKGKIHPFDRFRKEINGKVSLNEDGIRKKMSREEAFYKRIVNGALQGDPKFMALFMKFLLVFQKHAEEEPPLIEPPIINIHFTDEVKEKEKIKKVARRRLQEVMEEFKRTGEIPSDWDNLDKFTCLPSDDEPDLYESS